MKGKRFPEEQIIGILKEMEAGVPMPELCRKHGVSDGTKVTVDVVTPKIGGDFCAEVIRQVGVAPPPVFARGKGAR